MPVMLLSTANQMMKKDAHMSITLWLTTRMFIVWTTKKYHSASQKFTPSGFLNFFPKCLRIINQNLKRLLRVHIYDKLQNVIQLYRQLWQSYGAVANWVPRLMFVEHCSHRFHQLGVFLVSAIMMPLLPFTSYRVKRILWNDEAVRCRLSFLFLWTFLLSNYCFFQFSSPLVV